MTESDEGNRKEDAKLSRNLGKVAEWSQNLKRSAGLSRREDRDGENHESPRKGLQGWYGGGRKSMKEEKIKTIKCNIMKIQKSTRKKNT